MPVERNGRTHYSSGCRSTLGRAARRLVVAALGFAAAGPALANLLTNPGFESDQPFNTGSNWVLAGENQIRDCAQAHGGACSLRSSQSGAAAPGSYVTYQFVDTAAGQEYAFSFWYARYRTAFLDPVDGSYQVISGDVGSFVTVLSGDLTSTSAWASAGGTFVATGPLTRVSFRGDDFEFNAMSFDDFVLSPVPEAQTAVMLLAGLAVVAGALRRRSPRRLPA